MDGRVIEYVDHLHEHFDDPVVVRQGRYLAPARPGYSITMREASRLAHRYPRHEGTFHLLGEVEVVFGFWPMVLVTVILVSSGLGAAIAYVDGRDFTEPLFVFAIMVVAGSRPILQLTFGQEALNSDRNQGPDRPGGFQLVGWDEWFEALESQKLALRVSDDPAGGAESEFEFAPREG